MFKKIFWKIISQTTELKFHKKSKYRNTDNFTIESNNMFKKYGFNEHDYKNKNILDAGCGSKLRTLFFKDANLYVSEPLAEKFIKSIKWCDLKLAKKVYNTMSEEYIPELENNIDLIVCINVLDHCYNSGIVLNNFKRYLKNHGKLLLSVDVSDKFHYQHPSNLSLEYLENWFKTRMKYKIIEVNEHGYGIGKKVTIIAEKDTD
jgi:SAM-dependent methyltransferase